MRASPVRIAVGCVVVLVAACDAKTVELGGDDDAGLEGGSPRDGGADAAPWSTVCPADIPASGTPCSIVNLRCEYGESAEPVCNTIAYCELLPLRFVVTGPDPRCPLPPPTNPVKCPAAYASISQGSDCSSAGFARGEECGYPEGTCTCGQLGSNISPLPPPKWSCTAQPARCPQAIPRFGSPCTDEGLQCDYHPCDPAGASAFCQKGVWNGGAGGCAMPGNAADGG